MTINTQIETVVDSLEDGILVFDTGGRPKWMNRACRRLLNVDLDPDHDASETSSTVAKFINLLGIDPDGPSLGQGSKVLRTALLADPSAPDGRTVPVEVTVTATSLEAEAVFIATIRDISTQQSMERAVYEGRKTQAIGSLASGIAHDFNNILTAVISHIDLVLHGGDCPPQLRQHLLYAQTSARRGAELVGKLQAFSRHGQPKLEVVDLAEIAEQALFMLRRGLDPLIQIQAPEKSASQWSVKADANQLLQVILNISINAKDAMPKGGTLTVSLEAVNLGPEATSPRKPGEFVCLRIRDTGHGMPPDVVSRVFEPYFSTKDLSRGPGLGLSIAATVVTEHEGWIEVESAEGRGACFSIYLPKCMANAPQKPAVPAAGRPTEGKERILVVDDEELVRMVTKAVLAYRGYQISEAGDGEEAVRMYQAADPKYDLVLMDLHMPRMNGYDALRQIRMSNPRLKAVLLSGGTQDPSTLGGDLEGVAYLQKPFDNQELAAVVRRLLDGN